MAAGRGAGLGSAAAGVAPADPVRLSQHRYAAHRPLRLCASRAGKHAVAFLDTWRGALMVDNYGGYKALFAAGVTELACWVHARRTSSMRTRPVAARWPGRRSTASSSFTPLKPSCATSTMPPACASDAAISPPGSTPSNTGWMAFSPRLWATAV
ncbi:MAG: hypothetical protein EPN35_09945 [Rhodanobacter sp.]|nr:MAG: hypothetical protein EPN35_09945 [Rhodanobacter sp.]